MFQLLFTVLALFGGTMAVVAVDRMIRDNQVFEGYEVPWGVVVVMALLINVAALPYYFFRTRGSARWAFVGIGMWVAVCTVTLGAGAAGAIVDKSAIERRHRQRAAAAEMEIPAIDLPSIDQADSTSR